MSCSTAELLYTPRFIPSENFERFLNLDFPGLEKSLVNKLKPKQMFRKLF